MSVPKKYTGEARRPHIRLGKPRKPQRNEWDNPRLTETGEKMGETPAYRKYAAWCESLGIIPADVDTYEKVNS